LKNFYDHLDADVKALLLAQIRDLWTHTSTAIEGNSLTLGETSFILEEGLTIQGKPLKDHNEVFGHAKAIEIIYSLLPAQQKNISKQDLFNLHETVLTERIRDVEQPVGNWKRQSNYTTYINSENKQEWRKYPAPRNTDGLMSQWLNTLNAGLQNELTRTEAIQAYADLHLSFVSIHPFFDGNGRMARLLANLPVLNSGFPPVVVPQEDRYQYKLTLSNYQSTIQDLVNLKDISDLPKNAEKDAFVNLCKSYWCETHNLIDKANKVQEDRQADSDRPGF